MINLPGHGLADKSVSLKNCRHDGSCESDAWPKALFLSVLNMVGPLDEIGEPSAF